MVILLKDWIVSNVHQMDKEVEVVTTNNGELYGLRFKTDVNNIVPVSTLGNPSDYPLPCPVKECTGGNYLKRNGYLSPCYRCNSTGVITYEQAQKNNQKGYSNTVS